MPNPTSLTADQLRAQHPHWNDTFIHSYLQAWENLHQPPRPENNLSPSHFNSYSTTNLTLPFTNTNSPPPPNITEKTFGLTEKSHLLTILRYLKTIPLTLESWDTNDSLAIWILKQHLTNLAYNRITNINHTFTYNLGRNKG